MKKLIGNEIVKIELCKEEALVLDYFLSHFVNNINEKSILNEKPLFENKAELGALWRLSNKLEKELTETFLPNYQEYLDEAQKWIRLQSFGDDE